jgi:hypothetical protein
MAAAYDKARLETTEITRVKNDFIAKLEQAGRQVLYREKIHTGDLGILRYWECGEIYTRVHIDFIAKLEQAGRQVLYRERKSIQTGDLGTMEVSSILRIYI